MSEPKRRFFHVGIQAYKEQCAHGGVLIESAKKITDVPIYVFPPTMADVENYSLVPNATIPCLIVARAKTKHNDYHFPTLKDKKEQVQTLQMLIASEVLIEVFNEMADAFGDTKAEDALAADDPSVDVLEDEDVTHHTPSVEEAEGNSSPVSGSTSST